MLPEVFRKAEPPEILLFRARASRRQPGAEAERSPETTPTAQEAEEDRLEFLQHGMCVCACRRQKAALKLH